MGKKTHRYAGLSIKHAALVLLGWACFIATVCWHGPVGLMVLLGAIARVSP